MATLTNNGFFLKMKSVSINGLNLEIRYTTKIHDKHLHAHLVHSVFGDFETEVRISGNPT